MTTQPAATTNDGAFAARLRDATRRADSLLCVGLDPDPARFPPHLRADPAALLRFNGAIIDATRDLVCAYKPNLGFYAAQGLPGIEALLETLLLIPTGIPVILDCKVGDIGSTATAYARGYFDAWGFGAVTANPYLGEDSLAPLFAYPDRGVFVLCKTSNPGSGEVQDVVVHDNTNETQPLYLAVADRVAAWQARYPATIGLVVGATYPAQLAAVRARCPDAPILLPGVGAQAGDLAAAVAAGIDAHSEGLLVSASRSILYAGGGPDFAAQARAEASRLRDAINAARGNRGA